MIRLLLPSSTSFPSDVAAATVPSGAASSGALTAFPSAVPMGAPDTLALIAIGLAALAILLAFIAMTMLTIADRRAAAAERAQRAEIWASLPPHLRAATQEFTSLEHDEDDR